MSAHLVENKHTSHGIEDDLESSLYIVLWVALLCSKTHLTIPARSLLMKQVFKVDELEGVGSTTKLTFLNSRTQFGVNVFVDRKLLNRLILALAELFMLWYTVVTQEEQNACDVTCAYMEEQKACDQGCADVEEQACDQACTDMEESEPPGTEPETQADTSYMNYIMKLLNTNPAYKLKMNMEILRLHNKIIKVYDSHLQFVK
ncbi:uncharacterized protein EDB91DRAFT_1089441 [Suillus paluster]|uniref:uncharacterized protein n=1 Tax=Suillus paluster TaxID=48578 RepID=UPI001B886831|nr:uncharacterized protein EDB91DRAFT_1089441 [Suillus paluster]KAG1719269.1 hypothetical protein EDB91DRAFT_1089441 [Suillus paluster]